MTASRLRALRIPAVLALSFTVMAGECPVDDGGGGGNGNGNGGPVIGVSVASGSGQTGAVGDQLTTPVVARVTQDGTALSGATVAFSASGDGSADMATVDTDANGEASVLWTLGTTAGAQTLTASHGGQSAQASATADAGPPAAAVASTGDGQTALVGATLPTAPQVLVEDTYGNAVSGQQVDFAVTAGGGSITGGSTTTDANGLAAVGSWTLGSTAGTNELTATIVGTALSPFVFTANALLTLFSIEIRYVAGTTPSAGQQAAMDMAATQWTTFITGDLPDQMVNFAGGDCGGATLPAVSETVGNLLIYAEFKLIDGPFGTLGQAGPCVLRNGTLLPALGGMFFDTEDLVRLESLGELNRVILHEMGHVLGFGTLWDNLGFLQNPSDPTMGGTPGADTHFNGPAAIVAFDAAGGTAYMGGAKVPVENDNATFGTGSLDGHWREGVFDTELMTPRLDTSADALSAISVAAMGDIGYTVNPTGADSYALPGPAALLAGPRRFVDLGGDMWRGPMQVVDRSGRVTRVIVQR